jgi:hypothetical protein
MLINQTPVSDPAPVRDPTFARSQRSPAVPQTPQTKRPPEGGLCRSPIGWLIRLREVRGDEKFALLRAYRNNITRYRRLLKTELTEYERQFIERRMSEERSAMEKLAASTFPLAFKIPAKSIANAHMRS